MISERYQIYKTEKVKIGSMFTNGTISDNAGISDFTICSTNPIFFLPRKKNKQNPHTTPIIQVTMEPNESVPKSIMSFTKAPKKQGGVQAQDHSKLMWG